MSLQDLIEARSSSASLETPSAVSNEQAAGGVSSEVAVPVPEGVTENVTPNGIQIYFQSAPKRLYRICPIGYAANGWLEVPSVSEILDILEKGGLSWWGMRIGIAGVLELLDRGLIGPLERNPDFVETLLKQSKLTVNDTLSEAGDRGTSVHGALELWANKGILPQVDIYPPAEQGYVQGLLDFLIDSAAEPIDSEFTVGSLKHKYAGRPDLVALIPKFANVVVKTFPKAKPIRMQVPGGIHLLDLKTSKDVYNTHYLQLEAYETAAVEGGYDPTDYRAVIHVTKDGRYELAYNLTREKKAPDFDRGKLLAEFKDFKAIIGAYTALKRIDSR